MIITILKTWVEAHVWLKLATIENDLQIPKKFLTSEMQDSKALIKACFALQDYGFKIPHVNIISVTESETEMMVEYSLEGIDTIGCNHKNFIRNVELFLVQQLDPKFNLVAFDGLSLFVKNLKILRVLL